MNAYELERYLTDLSKIIKEASAAHDKADAAEKYNNDASIDVMHAAELAPSLLKDICIEELFSKLRNDRREAKLELTVTKHFKNWVDENRVALNKLDGTLGTIRKAIEYSEKEKFYTFKTDIFGKKGAILIPDPKKGDSDAD